MLVSGGKTRILAPGEDARLLVICKGIRQPMDGKHTHRLVLSNSFHPLVPGVKGLVETVVGSDKAQFMVW